ncbi:MAG: Gfo/Idh/MocA family oxidoreductase [Faecalibacterium sp.]|jgi:predicted dehydrogenase|nr:Gfo/Idh/MocA family oxidoreductase [Faecalibacterium sp.]
MSETISALFVGLGSIGTRHLKNLTAICAEQGCALRADALRSDPARPLRPGVAELLAHQFTSLSGPQALAQYDVAFITNPTHLHAEALRLVRGRAGALFIEKPILDAEQTGTELSALLAAGQKAYVAAPMRWCGVMLALKAYLKENPDVRPYSARVICSSYLPDWRPGVDYRTVYSAHRAMGGGVTIDLIHEWDYLVDLFGKPEEVYNLKGTYSELELDSDDLSVYIARWPHLLGEVHLDYFGRTYRRAIELFCREGTITADFGAGTLTLENGTVQHYEEDVNARYLREMAYFVDYARRQNVPSVNPPEEALDVLRLTLGKI